MSSTDPQPFIVQKTIMKQKRPKHFSSVCLWNGIMHWLEHDLHIVNLLVISFANLFFFMTHYILFLYFLLFSFFHSYFLISVQKRISVNFAVYNYLIKAWKIFTPLTRQPALTWKMKRIERKRVGEIYLSCLCREMSRGELVLREVFTWSSSVCSLVIHWQLPVAWVPPCRRRSANYRPLQYTCIFNIDSISAVGGENK